MTLPYPVQDLDFVLLHTAEFWTHFRGARLLITGGTGFIGSWLVQVVQRANDQLASGIELLVVSRDPDRARQQFPEAFNRKDTLLVAANLNAPLPELGRVDLCIHAATDVANPGKTGNSLQMFDSIVGGTRRVLDAAITGGARRFLLLSSGAIYGPQPTHLERIQESFSQAPDALRTDQAYGMGKRTAEWLACAYAAQQSPAPRHAMEASIARIFAVIGPGLPLNGTFAAGNFVRDALEGKSIVIQGDGRPVRSFLYMSDLCIWLLKILQCGKSGAAYNVGSAHAVSIADLARQVVAAVGTALPIEIRTPAQDHVLPPRYLPDVRKVQEDLHLSEYTPLETALNKTISWVRANRQQPLSTL